MDVDVDSHVILVISLFHSLVLVGGYESLL